MPLTTVGLELEQSSPVPVATWLREFRRSVVGMSWLVGFWQFVFFASVALIAYSYVGYPLLLAIVAKRRVQQPQKTYPTPDEWPEITVLIAAYNGAAHVNRRIDNIFDSNYPRHKLHILIASDGSTDETIERVNARPEPNVRALKYEVRRGKANTLAAAIPSVETDFIVLSDISTHFEIDTIRELVGAFDDPHVGVVTGKVEMVDGQGRSHEGLYWKLEALTKRNEARLGALLGASGAVYAMRKEAFVPPPRPVINDDYVFPALSRLWHGRRIAFAERAVAQVLIRGTLRDEFRRRIRIGRGAFQSLRVLSPWLNPARGWGAISFWSHKLLRWLCPFLMITAIVANGLLMHLPFFRWMMVAQLAFYGLALLGSLVRGHAMPIRVARIASSFVVMNLALLCGFVAWLMDSRRVTWEPTVRPSPVPTPLAIQNRRASNALSPESAGAGRRAS